MRIFELARSRHLATFGAYEIPREDYLVRLHQAIAREAVWPTGA